MISYRYRTRARLRSESQVRRGWNLHEAKHVCASQTKWPELRMHYPLNRIANALDVTVVRFDNLKVTIRLGQTPVSIVEADSGRRIGSDLVGH